MRVLICGGRDYSDKDTMFEHLDIFHANTPVTTVIHGGARGADKLAGLWAKERGIEVEVYPAQWELYGKSAGPKRNARMLSEGNPDSVIAFPGGAGTENMLNQSRKANVNIWRLG